MPKIRFEKIVELSQWLDLPKIDHKKNHIEARCPFCGDSKTKLKVRRLHIDFYPPYNTYVFKCFRCGESGNIFRLYSYVHNCTYEQAKQILSSKKYDPEEAKNRVQGSKIDAGKDNNIEVDKDIDLDFENECFSLSYIPKSNYEKNIVKKLHEFKTERKIPDSFPLYIAHSGRYKGRIIIPIYINNKMVYFQGRAIYEEIYPKYLNPETEKSKIILNIDNFDPDKYIIITEGIIDAYMVENNQGTCVIGGYVDMHFINNLLPYTNKGVIIALDNPKIDNNSYSTLKKLVYENINRYKEKINFFIMPKEYDAKDLNDLVKDYNINNIYDFVVNNKKSILYMKTYFM